MEIRDNSKHGELHENGKETSKVPKLQSKSQKKLKVITEDETKETNNNQKAKPVKYSKKVQDELDLNDLLYHVPKLKHVSKMEYLDEKKEYEAQLRKQGKFMGDKNENNDHNTSSNTTLKFQFIDKTDAVSTTFQCHVYYPFQFRALRRKLYHDYDNDSDFITSLSRCQSWNASGGKKVYSFISP